MTLDQTTLIAIQTLLMLIAGSVFVLDAAIRRHDAAVRHWTLSFIAGMLTAFSYLIWDGDHSLWWAVAIGNGAFVLSIASMWTGFRVYNGRRPLVGVAVVAGLVAIIAVLIEGPDGGSWAGGAVLLAGVGAFGAVTATEALRGRASKHLHARIMAIGYFFVTIFYGGRLLAFWGWGWESALFNQYFGTVPTSLVTITFSTIGFACLSVLRGDSSLGSSSQRNSPLFGHPGILNDEAFDDAVEDVLERADFHQAGYVLIEAQIDRLPEMNLASGWAFGDDAIANFADILRWTTPPSSIITHRRGGRFAILIEAEADADADAIIETIQTTLVDEPMPSSQRMRYTASFGIAHTDLLGYDRTDLAKAATDACEGARILGGNSAIFAERLNN